MQTSISKRLLAGLLSIVMVLSLFAATPAKSEAANTVKTLATIELNGGTLADGTMVNAIEVTGVKLGTQVYTSVENKIVSVNNGTYNLDPEQQIWNTDQYVIVAAVKFDDDDAAAFKAITAAQANIGNDFSGSTTSTYTTASYEVRGNVAYFTIKTVPADEVISDGEIESLAAMTKVVAGKALPTTLKGYKDLPFVQGVLTWKLCTTTTSTVVTKASAAAVDGTAKWYEVSCVLSAKPGYRFDAAALDSTVGAMTVKTTEQQAADGYKTVKLTISKIASVANPELTALDIDQIILPKAVNYGTNDVVTAADVLAKVGKMTFTIKVGDKEITCPTFGKDYWTLFAGNDLDDVDFDTVLDPADVLVELDANDVTISGHRWTDATYFAAYPIELIQYYFASYTDYADTHNLLGIYAEDGNNGYNTVTDASGNSYWVVQVTKNLKDTYRDNNEAVAAKDACGAPKITFDQRYTDDPYYYDVYETGARGDNLVISRWEDTAATVWDNTLAYADKSGSPRGVSTAKNSIGYYLAYTEGSMRGNVLDTVNSPVTIAYFDPTVGAKDATKGIVSLNITEPEALKVVTYGVISAGTMDMASAFDHANATLYWDGFFYNFNTGAERFYYDQDYTATITVPVAAGYTVKTAPTVLINGTAVDAANVKLEDVNGFIYLIVTAKFTANEYYNVGTAAALGIAEDRVSKPLWTDMEVPVIGGTVQKTINPTQSSSRYYTFESVTWYENGVEFTGTTFAKDKRYTAVVTFDCSKFNIYNQVTNMNKIIGAKLLNVPGIGDSAVDSAKITAAGKCVVSYDFGIAKNVKITGVNDLEIVVPHGLTKGNFYTYVEANLKFVANCEGGITTLVEYDDADIAKNWFKAPVVGGKVLALTDAMEQNYNGILGYDEETEEAQDFDLVAVFANGTSTFSANVRIHVAGVTANVTFNANGGTYTGSNLVVEKGMPYGFKYVKSQIYRPGYFFQGWYDAAEGGNRIYATTKFTKATTLYAHWAKTFTGMVKTFTAKSYSAGRLTVTATKPVTNVDGYEFSYSKDGVNWTTATQAKNVKYFIGLEKGTYSVRVRAYRIDSAGYKVYGAYSKVVKATVK